MRIANNIMALNTHRAYTNNNDKIASSAEKLSSGYRINRAGDDAAGLAISEKMRAQIRGLNMAAKNGQDAISLVQTAEGALQETHNILQRMRELAVQSASDTNEKVIDRGALQQEFAQLQEEINDIANKTVFNDQKLIDGTFASKINDAKSADIEGFVNGNGKEVDGTFESSGGSVILANNVKAGNYTFGVKQVTTGAITGSQPKKATAVNNIAGAETAIFKIASDNKDDKLKDDSLPDDPVTGLGDAALDSNLNGKWTVKVDQSTGEIYAQNENGSRFTGVISTDSDDKNLIVNFNGLGQLKLEADDDTDYTGLADKGISEKTAKLEGQTFTLSGAATVDLGETKFYATMSGANDVEIRVGDESVTFANGITLKFGEALSYDDLSIAQGADPSNDGMIHADDSAFAGGLIATGKVTVSNRAQEGLIIQTGANEGDELKLNIDRMDTKALGISLSSVSTRTKASHALTDITNAINEVSTQRAALGAMQNRLDHKIANLKVSAENLQAAESRIRDVDIASEMTKYTQSNILSQAATAMLAQANSAPQNVLSLLK